MILLAVEIAFLVIGLLYCFFGYRLARILLPLCGTALMIGALRIFLPEYFSFGAADQLIISLSGIIIFYILLFMLKRLAAFFTGLAALAFVAVLVADIFDLTALDAFFPVSMAVCILAGLMAFVYMRIGVIVTASLFGGCIAALFSMMIITSFSSVSGINGFINSTAEFLTANALLIAIIAFWLAAAGVLVQLFLTGKKTLLPAKSEKRRMTQKETSQPNTGRNSFI